MSSGAKQSRDISNQLPLCLMGPATKYKRPVPLMSTEAKRSGDISKKKTKKVKNL